MRNQNEKSANYRKAIDRNRNKFNPRNRDYNNYEEFGDESAINPLDKPINGRVDAKDSRMNKANRKVNDSLDD